MNRRVLISVVSSLFLTLLNGSFNGSVLADDTNAVPVGQDVYTQGQPSPLPDPTGTEGMGGTDASSTSSSGMGVPDSNSNSSSGMSSPDSNTNSPTGMGKSDSNLNNAAGQGTVGQDVYQQQNSSAGASNPNSTETQVENDIDKVISMDGSESSQNKGGNGGNISGYPIANPEQSKMIQDLVLKLKQDDLAETDEEAQLELKEKLKHDLEKNQMNTDKIKVLTALEIKDNQNDQAKQDIDAAILKNPKDDNLYSVLKSILVKTNDTDDIKVYINGQKPQFDVQPYLDNDHLLVPVRTVAETLGATVSWNEDTKTATIQTEKVSIKLPLGSNSIQVNGQNHMIETALAVKNDRVMVPIRFVSEYLGYHVNWDSQTNVVIIK